METAIRWVAEADKPTALASRSRLHAGESTEAGEAEGDDDENVAHFYFLFLTCVCWFHSVDPLFFFASAPPVAT
jgi:hypothetical protein